MKRLTLVLTLCLVPLFLVGFLTAQSSPGAPERNETSLRVVRAYYDDPALIAQVAAWNEPWEINQEEGYMVLEVSQAEYDFLLELGFSLIVDEALTRQINTPNQMLPGQGGGIPGYPCYRTVEETLATGQAIATNYPTLATWIDIGDSWEKVNLSGAGYDMMVLRLTNSAIPGPKPKLYVEGAIHAREYTTAEMVTRFAEYLVQNYGIDADVTWLLDYHEIHLLLQTNPDGRKKAEAGFSWRKNTNQNYCGAASNNRGADLNRNFPFEWGQWGGSSGVACDQTYRGASPASEPEAAAVVNYIHNQYPDTRLAPEDDFTTPALITTTGTFIDMHSYGRLVMWSWGIMPQASPNSPQLQTLGRKFAYFNNYTPQQAYTLYPTDGTTRDFAYGDWGLPAYTIEMGNNFFESCSAFENVIVPANMPVLLYAAKAVRAPYVLPAGPDALNVATSVMTATPGLPVTLTATINDTRYNNSNGTEPTQNIAAASYYLDVPPWITSTTPIPYPMTATDGTFNSSIENVVATIDTTGLSLGRHLIYVRGQDANGNWGAVTARFLDIVTELPPTAGFTSSSPDTLGETTSFTDTSTGTNISGYSWDFGDGNSSITQNPTHQYAAAGTYTVTLTVTNPAGNDSFSDIVTILPAAQPNLYLPTMLKP